MTYGIATENVVSGSKRPEGGAKHLLQMEEQPTRESSRPNSESEIDQMHTIVSESATFVNTSSDDTVSLTLKAMMDGVQRAEKEENTMTRESIQPYSGGKLAKFQKIRTVPTPAEEKGGDDTVCHSSVSRMCGAQDMEEQGVATDSRSASCRETARAKVDTAAAAAFKAEVAKAARENVVAETAAAFAADHQYQHTTKKVNVYASSDTVGALQTPEGVYYTELLIPQESTERPLQIYSPLKGDYVALSSAVGNTAGAYRNGKFGCLGSPFERFRRVGRVVAVADGPPRYLVECDGLSDWYEQGLLLPRNLVSAAIAAAAVSAQELKVATDTAQRAALAADVEARSDEKRLLREQVAEAKKSDRARDSAEASLRLARTKEAKCKSLETRRAQLEKEKAIARATAAEKERVKALAKAEKAAPVTAANKLDADKATLAAAAKRTERALAKAKRGAQTLTAETIEAKTAAEARLKKEAALAKVDAEAAAEERLQK